MSDLENSSQDRNSALPEWLPLYTEADIPKSVRNEIYAMGTSTMDRILKPIRAQKTQSKFGDPPEPAYLHRITASGETKNH